MINILSIVLGLCFFIVPMWAYRKGLNDGLRIHQGNSLEPIKTPLQVVSDFKEKKIAKEEQDKVIEGLNNLMAYDGTPQGEGET